MSSLHLPLLDWLNLLVRWAHIVAGIMWIGNSFLFVWLDSALHGTTRAREGDVVGEIWLVHSGGFYEVVKRRSLRPEELGPPLYIFKWQSYMTWITGVLLLGIVYWAAGSVMLVDTSVATLTPAQAVALSVTVLLGGWILYDLIWTAPFAEDARLGNLLSVLLLVAAAYGLTHVFSARAAFIHFGALIGTCMAGNVFRHIVPGQSRMLADTRAGRPVDTTPGARAKARSMHNHYLTLPVLFTMISNHFAMTYGHAQAWIVLLLLTTVGMCIKYVMNHRLGGNRAVLPIGVAALLALLWMTAQVPASSAAGAAGARTVPFAEAEAIVQRRCVACHAEHPTNASFTAPPNGVRLDAPERIVALAPRIMERAVVTKTMPLGNITGMTDAERATLGAWIAQGARR